MIAVLAVIANISMAKHATTAAIATATTTTTTTTATATTTTTTTPTTTTTTTTTQEDGEAVPHADAAAHPFCSWPHTVPQELLLSFLSGSW